MTWWLIPLILGVIGAGFLGGLNVSSILLRRHKGEPLNAFNRVSIAQQEKRTSTVEKIETSQATSILDIAQTLLKNPTHGTSDASQKTPNKELPLNETIGADRKSTGKEQPYTGITDKAKEPPAKDQSFNTTGRVIQKHPVSLDMEITPEIEISQNAAMAELKQNLALAEKPLNGTLHVFQTAVWDNKRGEFDVMDPEIKWQITEAYTDMFLANNIVRLSRELGGDDEHMTQSYLELKGRIAECLRRVSPAVPTALRT